ncbi:MAG: CopD family protein [Candidatus Binatus sp.]|uniref:copper resistance D family protein n=1 Tax=Candidatus Binatus sp. TaxID=2811406 RepID=UPI0027289F8A|nr:CopD family protein [Candidatus Binatus sp.]MDO8432007.1 CopD family protein [Candidatus Binatus sp.]
MTPTQLSALATWPLLIASTVIFGTSAFALFFDAAESAAPLDSFGRVWLWLAAINLAVSPLAMLVQIANMADCSMRDAIVLAPMVMRETVFGHLWAIRLPVAILLAAITATRSPSRRTAAFIYALATALLLMQSLSSHAIDKGARAVAILFAHQAAAGFWIGALSSLLIVAASDDGGSALIERTAVRVSRVAGWSVAMLALTGVGSAYFALGWHPQLLIYSLYGRTLLWKLATAGAVLLVGGYNRYQLVSVVGEESPRSLLIRNVTAECLLLAAVLAWSSVLANTPPPH